MNNVAENLREIVTPNGTYSLVREDPWGLWVFKTESGPVPKDLQGMYTNPSVALEMVTNWSGKQKTKAK